MKATSRRESFLMTAAFASILLIALAVLSLIPGNARSQASSTITGFAWSGTIGWISLDCHTGGPTNNDVCATTGNYGLTAASTGMVTGYAWSDAVGWIKFGGLSSFPSTGGDAQIVNGVITGWARACAGTATGNCSTMTSRTDGWDGWISLSGTASNGAPYGPTIQPGGIIVGYAWGSDVVGWIDLQYAQTTFAVCALSSAYSCVNSGGVSGTGSTYNIIRRTDTDALCAVTTTDLTPTCGPITFCSLGSAVCVFPPPSGVGSLTVSPLVVTPNSVVKIAWNVANATCTVHGTNDDGTGSNSTGTWSAAASGAVGGPCTTSSNCSSGSLCVDSGGTKSCVVAKVSSTIAQQTTYTLACTADDGSAFPSQSISVNVQPFFEER